ncbi:MAG: hypothetical protein WBF42_10740 [Terracidiphilus sp.]
MIRLRFVDLVVVAASVSLGSVISPQIVNAQVAPAAQRVESGQMSARAANSASSNPKEVALYAFQVTTRYRYFIEFVGREDGVIQKQIEDGKPPDARTDYESAIGIGDGDEAAMLAILVDAAPKMISAFDEIDERCSKLLPELLNNIDAVEHDPDLRALSKEQSEIVKETRASLGRELGARKLKKIDAYVYGEFLDRIGPASQDQPGFNLLDVDRAEYRTANAGADEEKAVLRRYAFSVLFQQYGIQLRRKSAAAKGTEDAPSPLPAYIPKEKEVAVRSIIRGAADQIAMINVQEWADIGKYHKNVDPGPVPHRLPPELAADQRAYWTTTDRGIEDLRRLLGDEVFAKFDRAVTHIFGSGMAEVADSDALLMNRGEGSLSAGTDGGHH